MKEGGVVKRHKLNGMDEDDMVEGRLGVVHSEIVLTQKCCFSTGKRTGILYHDGCRLSGRKSSYDQCDNYSHVTIDLRIQRYVLGSSIVACSS